MKLHDLHEPGIKGVSANHRVRLRPADPQQAHRFAAEQFVVVLVLTQLSGGGCHRQGLEAAMPLHPPLAIPKECMVKA